VVVVTVVVIVVVVFHVVLEVVAKKYGEETHNKIAYRLLTERRD